MSLYQTFKPYIIGVKKLVNLGGRCYSSVTLKVECGNTVTAEIHRKKFFPLYIRLHMKKGTSRYCSFVVARIKEVLRHGTDKESQSQKANSCG